jgi:hypothetical protein
MENEDRIKIKILEVRPLVSPELITYLNSLYIDLNIAKKYCEEVDFELNNRQHAAIGFKNDTGGFALQNAYFKGTAETEFTTLISNTKSYNSLSVFEDFLDFLSYQTGLPKLNVSTKLPQSQTSFLILSNLTFFEMSIPLMERHKSVKLYLDVNKRGFEQPHMDIFNNKKYKDCSKVCKALKDCNTLIMNKGLKQNRVKRLGKRL